jgi:hypothetical protein
MTSDTSQKAAVLYSEPDHTGDNRTLVAAQDDNNPIARPSAGGGGNQIGVLEGEWVPPPPLPEGKYTLVVSDSTGPKTASRPYPTFIGLTVTVVEGQHAGRSIEQKVFRLVTNYGEKQRLVSATALAQAIDGHDAPERTFEEAAEVIEQARKQRLPFRAKVTWGALDHAEFEERAGRPGNARGRSMILGAARFDQADKHGQPVARGIDGQLLRPQPYITRFLPRRKDDTPRVGAVAKSGGHDERS